MDDLISRQAAIDAECAACSLNSARERGHNCRYYVKGCPEVECLRNLPSAQPERQWIPITTRPMTEDERQEWSEKLGYNIDDDEAVIYGNLPDDGQRVLVYNKYSGEVGIDTFFDDDEGCYFEDNGDMDGITHWMPLPEKPKGE